MSVECVEPTRGSVVSVRENGRRASFNNPNNELFHKIRVDGCLIKDGIRADWMVRKVGSCVVFVELKGADVAHACKQLQRTRTHNAVRAYLEDRIAYLIVSSRSPSFDTRVAKAKEDARREGAKLTVKSRECVCEVETLL